MQSDMRHLVDLQDKTEKEKNRMANRGYEEIPKDLRAEAAKLLKDKKEMIVKDDGGVISEHAKKMRKKRIQKSRKRRKKNRRK
jgi:hypothetical protein